MTDNVVSVHSSSAEERDVWTVNSSSAQAVTISSSRSEHLIAVPVIDLARDDSPQQSNETIEHVASSRTARSALTIADDISDEELDILEARETAARLASEAAARAQEAANARLRLLEARARSSRSSRASQASRTTRTLAGNENTNNAVNVANFELPIQERTNAVREEGTRSATLHREHHQPHGLRPHHAEHAQSARQEPVPERASSSGNEDRDEKIKELQNKLAALEEQRGNEMKVVVPIANIKDEGKGVGSLESVFDSASSEPKNSAFMTPRHLPDLIDLSTPPRNENKEKQESPGYKQIVRELRSEIADLGNIIRNRGSGEVLPPVDPQELNDSELSSLQDPYPILEDWKNKDFEESFFSVMMEMINDFLLDTNIIVDYIIIIPNTTFGMDTQITLR